MQVQNDVAHGIAGCSLKITQPDRFFLLDFNKLSHRLGNGVLSCNVGGIYELSLPESLASSFINFSFSPRWTLTSRSSLDESETIDHRP